VVYAEKPSGRRVLAGGLLEKKGNFVVWVIIAVIFFYALQFAFQGIRTIVNLQFDDAYYYLEIAKNIADGKGATFDGLHKTNGFHPLWLLILTGLASFPGLGLVGLTRAMVVLQAFLLLGSLVLIKNILKGLLNPFLVAGVLLIVLYPRFFHIFTVGMESGLLIFLLLLTFYLMPKLFRGISTGNWFLNSLVLGVLSAAIVLARLDAFVFPAAVLVALVVNGAVDGKAFRRSFTGAVLAGLVTVLALLPFLVWNYHNFGTMATVSSMMKVKWDLSKLGFNLRYLPLNTAEYYAGVLVALVAVLLLRGKKYVTEEQRKRFVYPLLVFVIPAILILVFFLVFVKWALFAYAFASTLPVIITGAACLFVLIYNAIRSDGGRRKFAFVVFILACVLAVGLQAFSLSRVNRSAMMRIYDATLWAQENTPEDAVFAMKDCGAFGYYSERTTINLDGMVNDFEYQEYLRRGELEEYLNENGVDYFVQHAFWFGDAPVNTGDYEEYSLYIPCRVYEGEGGTLTVTKENEVFRSEYYCPRTHEPTRVIVWRYE
jgi:hypothetical protein